MACRPHRCARLILPDAREPPECLPRSRSEALLKDDRAPFVTHARLVEGHGDRAAGIGVKPDHLRATLTSPRLGGEQQGGTGAAAPVRSIDDHRVHSEPGDREFPHELLRRVGHGRLDAGIQPADDRTVQFGNQVQDMIIGRPEPAIPGLGQPGQPGQPGRARALEVLGVELRMVGADANPCAGDALAVARSGAPYGNVQILLNGATERAVSLARFRPALPPLFRHWFTSAMDAPALAALRDRALDMTRARDWPGLLAIEAELRTDRDLWTQLWGPCCAVAARMTGRPDARDRLEECARAGFYQLGNLGVSSFDEAFGGDPDWPDVRARIMANVPPPPIELTRWPTAPPAWPLGLFRLDPPGEERLAGRLPGRLPGAWATAEMLLHWVTRRWRHNGVNHDESFDANVLLDRAGNGDRFACREYGVLLTQALNAVQIPARRLSLYRADYHAGLGGGHAVTEAWIDDLGKWVVLDGQNGAVWRDESGCPLGVLELQQRYRDRSRPQFDGDSENFVAEAADEWFSYFFAAAITGVLAWSAGPFVPLSEGSAVISCDLLADSAAAVAPDLAAISIGVTDAGPSIGVTDPGPPALAFRATHPFATGFEVTGPHGGVASLGLEQPFPLGTAPGEYQLAVAARTPYGALAAQPLSYVVR